MKTLRPIALLLALLLAIPVFAADGERHVVGDIQAKGADSITVVLDSKKAETFAVTDATVVLRGREKITMLNVEVGEAVMVFAKKIGGQETATSVTVKPRT